MSQWPEYMFVFLIISFPQKLSSYQTTVFWKLFLVVYLTTLSVLALYSANISEVQLMEWELVG
jgi:hypothetical protein